MAGLFDFPREPEDFEKLPALIPEGTSEEEREYLVPGLAAYAGLSLIGAVLAFRKAGANNVRAEGAARFQPRPGGLQDGIDVQGPAFFASAGQIGVTWLRVAF